MATHECFERHLEQAQCHENRVRMLVEDNNIRGTIPQQSLAIREYREAARIRPRNDEVQIKLHAAQIALQRLKTACVGPKVKPLLRFVSHFNLAIRYWDLGKPTLARYQAEAACVILRHHDLPLGCAAHNAEIMTELSRRYAESEHRLDKAVTRNPDSIMANYDLGVLLFDKRMLLKAEAQLLWAQERAKAVQASILLQRERGPFQVERTAWVFQDKVEGTRYKKLQRCLQGIDDDLRFLQQLKADFCEETDGRKHQSLRGTGVRDGLRPQLLQCMRCRFTSDTDECSNWWVQLTSRSDVDLRI